MTDTRAARPQRRPSRGGGLSHNEHGLLDVRGALTHHAQGRSSKQLSPVQELPDLSIATLVLRLQLHEAVEHDAATRRSYGHRQGWRAAGDNERWLPSRNEIDRHGSGARKNIAGRE